MNRIVALIVALIVLLLVGSSTLYTVDQRKYAVIVAGGQVVQVVDTPGLHLKAPPPFQSVVLLDRRVQSVDNPDGDRFATSDNKVVLADVLVKWRIADPRAFMSAFGTDLSVGPEKVATQVREGLNAVVAQHTLGDLIADQRDATLDAARAKAAATLGPQGVELVDVRFERLDLLAEESGDVYRKMSASVQARAQQIRAEGLAQAETIRTEAEDQRTAILADGQAQAQTIKGKGDDEAGTLYADAYGRDPKFYAFYRSLEAYRASFANPRDVIVVDPSSAFFRFMRDPAAALGAAGDAAPSVVTTRAKH
ncbi:protease modulator HflC [Pararobbsia silviterrae]|uniref:Protein HflC n=1 Tax=Pararobbsia silviterrae TaxID=1792498 RepID=A0A494XVK2_9BURK|nr:protease modulator HflC [Pararobbsia silviterrae]RKP54608.1 protease modulator HflC [Pararobbsia silviterrae]